MKTFLLPLLSIALLPIGLTNCTLQKAVSRTEPTQFLKSTGVDTTSKKARLPFDHAWGAPGMDYTKYKYIVVRPVTTTYLRSERWEESKSTLIPTKRAYLKRCAALARHWDKSLSKAFSSPLCMFYKTTNTSQPGTLILEIALTDVRFSSAVRATGEKPLPAADLANAVSGSTPVCAFESRTLDAATGKIVTTAADRRGPELKFLNPDSGTLAKPNEAICDEWAEQLMQRSNKEIFPTVQRKWFSFF